MVTKIVVKRLGVALSSVSSTDKIGSTWSQGNVVNGAEKILTGLRQLLQGMHYLITPGATVNFQVGLNLFWPFFI